MVGFDFPKYNMISMSPNIPKDDINFFNRMFENFTIGFIFFYKIIQAEKGKSPS